MAEYKSVGTIRYEYEGEEQAEESVVNWFFVPDANYCVMQHHKKDCAVFLGEGDSATWTNLTESGVKLVIPKENDILKGKVEDAKDLTWRELLCFWEAKSAAMSQSKVMVTVEKNGNDLSLIGISPPPK